MMEKSNSKYDSFLFWRQPIPALNMSELEDLGLAGNYPGNFIKVRSEGEEDSLSEFSSFKYWRSPIADIDSLLADLNLLL